MAASNQPINPSSENFFQSDFFRKVFGTILSRVLLIAFAYLTSVVISRTLGPSGRGLFMVATTLGMMGALFGTLGLHIANIFHSSQNRELLPPLTGNTLAVGLGFGGLLAAGMGLFFWLFPSATLLQGWPLWLALAWIPVNVTYILLQNLILGMQQVVIFNVIELTLKGVFLAALGILVLFHFNSVNTALSCNLLILVLCTFWIYFALRPFLGTSPRLSIALFKEHLSYGMKVYVTSLLSFLVLRLGLLMVQHDLGAEEAGYYSIVSNMADLVLMPTVVVGFLLLPKLSATKDPIAQWKYARQIGLYTLLFMGLMCGMAMIGARWFILFSYGKNFLPAIQAFQWMLPGAFFLGLQTVAVQILYCVGYPKEIVWAWVAALLLNVFSNLWAIPMYGIAGAAFSSSASYFLIFLFTLLILLKIKPKKVPAQIIEKMQHPAQTASTLFSVIIPLHNKQDYIERALRSVLAQTCQDFEIIVVNDGSTDGSVEKIKNFVDPRIRLHHQSNLGVSAARNQGIALARGRFMAFLDADDEWCPDFLASIHRLAEDYPEAGLYGTNYWIGDKLGDKTANPVALPIGWRGILHDFYALTYFRRPIFCQSSTVVPVSLARQYPFEENIKSGEDTLFWFRLSLLFPTAYTNQKCVIYYVEIAGNTHGAYVGPEHRVDWLIWKKRLQTLAPLSSAAEKFTTWHALNQVRIMLLKGQKKEALGLLSRCPINHFTFYHFYLYLLAAWPNAGSLHAPLSRIKQAWINRHKDLEKVDQPAFQSNLRRLPCIPVLFYHRIVDEIPQDSTYEFHCTLRHLEQQLIMLKTEGYETVVFEDMIQKVLPPKPVILTFDDGYEDIYLRLFPLLKKYRQKAVVYLLGNPSLSTNQWDTHLKYPKVALLNIHQIQEMAQSGLVEFGCHSRTHASLVTLTPDELEKEIIGSKKYLEEVLGKPVLSFAYPFGHYNQTVVQKVAEAGYRFAVTTENDIRCFSDDLMRIRRFSLSPGSGLVEFLFKSSWLYFLFIRLRWKLLPWKRQVPIS